MTLVLSVAIGMMLSTSMLLAGFRWGQRRALGALAKLLDEGRFALHTADGRSASSRDLLQAMGAMAGGPGTAASKPVVAMAVVVACVALAFAFVVVSQAAP
jgi:hypothetical protein